MALKDLFKKRTKQTDVTNVLPKEETDIVPFASDAFPVVKLNNTQLTAYKSIPLSGLAALGPAFLQMSEKARTVVQSVNRTVTNNEPLFVGINPKGVQGTLQRGEYGINGNIMRINSQGKNVVAGRMQFKEYGGLPATETATTTLPLDPTLMIVAVAIMTIEKKLMIFKKALKLYYSF